MRALLVLFLTLPLLGQQAAPKPAEQPKPEEKAAPAEAQAAAKTEEKAESPVPAGEPALWSHPPYAADLVDGRVYGRGTRYSTIYLANQDQIRDPDMIWPGQVFGVPDKSREGEAADMSKMGAQATTKAQ